MILEVTHHSLYQYEKPVFLEPQHFYYHPLHRNYIRLLDWKFEVSPAPQLSAQHIDLENNVFYQSWFDASLDRLQIKSFAKLEVTPFNPFDFLEEMQPKTDETHAQRLYLNKIPLSRALIDWSNKIEKAHIQTVPLLTDLCAKIHQGWKHTIRYDHSLLHPDVCFQEKQGACRDLAWLMVQICRHFKIPSRFVSGYCFNPDLGDGHELHAWVEVFIYGAGWIGLDPSSGLFTTEYYIPVATSYHPMNTLPVQGVYRGDASSQLETKVLIHTD
ncbi:MAG: transglutaminase family protein [Bacteroidota bacterium]